MSTFVNNRRLIESGKRGRMLIHLMAMFFHFRVEKG